MPVKFGKALGGQQLSIGGRGGDPPLPHQHARHAQQATRAPGHGCCPAPGNSRPVAWSLPRSVWCLSPWLSWWPATARACTNPQLPCPCPPRGPSPGPACWPSWRSHACSSFCWGGLCGRCPRCCSAGRGCGTIGRQRQQPRVHQQPQRQMPAARAQLLRHAWTALPRRAASAVLAGRPAAVAATRRRLQSSRRAQQQPRLAAAPGLGLGPGLMRAVLELELPLLLRPQTAATSLEWRGCTRGPRR
jgi:hypothetical protein